MELRASSGFRNQRILKKLRIIFLSKDLDM
jgi:hypothetical protein